MIMGDRGIRKEWKNVINLSDISITYESNGYGKFKIVDYIDSRNVVVEFVRTKFKSIVRADSVRRGAVRDNLYPVICGVGFMGVGPHPTAINRKVTVKYQTWRNMIGRCYCPEVQKTQPSYIGCSVSSIWHNFQNFADWYDLNYIDGLQLDKDIKVKGNRVYGPDTCIFTTPTRNVEEAISKHYQFTNPKGEKIKVFNLRKFCKKNNLSQSKMSLVNSGDRNHHKGWRKA